MGADVLHRNIFLDSTFVLKSATTQNRKPLLGILKDGTLTRIATLLIGLTFLTSCDCLRQVTGTVLDKATGQPVTFAEVKILSTNKSSTTDSLGNFKLSFINSGLQCYCKPKYKVSISSPLYFTDTFTLNKSQYKLKADTNNINTFIDP